MKKIEVCFNSFCYLATLSLLGFCIHIYCKNEDISEIIYRRYGENSVSLYPSLSFCVQLEEYYVRQEVLKSHGTEFNSTAYLSSLNGDFWNSKMINISYNETIKSLLDHVVYVSGFDSYDTKEKRGFVLEGIYEVSFSLSNVEQIYKCITFDLPNHNFRKLQFVSLAIQASVFPNGIRPGVEKFFVNIHHPKKFFTPLIAHKFNWPKRNKSYPNHLVMQFSMKSMEVLHRRDKTSNPCQYYKNYDEVFKEKLVQGIGCYPPYWQYNGSISECRSKEKLKLFAKHTLKAIVGTLETSDFITQPCVELRKLMFDYDEFETDLENLNYLLPDFKISQEDSLMIVMLNFLDPFLKEIKQSRAFGIESLIGNIGGYMGLLLGVSIIQLPRFCTYWYNVVMGRNNNQKNIENNNDKTEEPV